MDKTLRVWAALPVPAVFRRSEATDATSPLRPAKRIAHRADIGSATAAGDILTRLVAVLLSTINAVMWEVYTESRFMAAVWAIIAIGIAVWIKRDAARR